MFGIESLYSAEGMFAYALVFLLAATPWIEILVVIPAGIALGLNPLAVSILAFTGNLTTVYLLIFAYQYLSSTFDKHKSGENKKQLSKRKKKALHIWNKYGFPGLAFISPLTVGTHFATFVALSFKSKKYMVTMWITGSIFVWTVIVTVVSYYGIESLKWLLG
ncbi:small multi-drug export protein [Methanolobus profundi]|uniref:Putative small multi-drug export protein n=1 Tax=Methanolobus profundi TaxID=487685 RepID=A0A1I4R4Y4_9EURY|nr:small multi-drug export protein [Methanolobus profundi]SFM46990.1 Putative small multi-drug export protein [Methanolobus profundi]